jgi:hypothetical protein
VLIEEALREEDARAARQPNWYVSVVVEQDIDLQEGFVPDRKYLWVDVAKAMELEAGLRSHASPHLDVLATCVSTVIASDFFEEVVVDDRVFFSAPGRDSFGLPSFSVGAVGVIMERPLESLALTELERRLHGAAKLPRGKHQSLDTVARWHLAAIAERDPWKRFFWSFLALEVLTHRLFAILDTPTEGRMDLADRFELVALRLFPDRAASDLADFRRGKKARDDLAHGRPREADRLPVMAVRSLLERYLAAGLQYWIGQ